METAKFELGFEDSARMNIRYLLRVEGKDQRDLANHLGLSQASISRKLAYGSGNSTHINLTDLEGMAEALGFGVRVQFIRL